MIITTPTRATLPVPVFEPVRAARLAWEKTQDQQPLFEIGAPPMAPVAAAAVLTPSPLEARAAAAPLNHNGHRPHSSDGNRAAGGR